MFPRFVESLILAKKFTKPIENNISNIGLPKGLITYNGKLSKQKILTPLKPQKGQLPNVIGYTSYVKLKKKILVFLVHLNCMTILTFV